MPFSLPYGAREGSVGRVGENHGNEVALPSPFSITRFNFFGLQVLLTRASLLALAKSIYYSQTCLVPRPYYIALRVTWSERVSGCSSRIRHRNSLTEKAWKRAAQVLGTVNPRLADWLAFTNTPIIRIAAVVSLAKRNYSCWAERNFRYCGKTQTSICNKGRWWTVWQ